jgi:hypothetical protein
MPVCNGLATPGLVQSDQITYCNDTILSEYILSLFKRYYFTGKSKQIYKVSITHTIRPKQVYQPVIGTYLQLKSVENQSKRLLV